MEKETLQSFILIEKEWSALCKAVAHEKYPFYPCIVKNDRKTVAN